MIRIDEAQGDDPFALDPADVDLGRGPRPLGSFTAATSQYWEGTGDPIPIPDPDIPGENIWEDRTGERLWRIADGRWVVTTHHKVGAELLDAAAAEAWFARNRYTAEDRELLIRSGHRQPAPGTF